MCATATLDATFAAFNVDWEDSAAASITCAEASLGAFRN